MVENRALSSHFRLERLAEGVFAAIASDSGYGLCNGGIIDLGDATVVFDSMLTPQAGADLRRAAEDLTHHPVSYLINSHYHGDHVRGNASFPSVRIVSTRKVRELIEERALKHLESDKASAPSDLADLRTGRLPATPRDRTIWTGWLQGILETPVGTMIPGPDLFVDDRLVLRGPKRELWVMTYGGGHSPSDVFGFLPDDKVAFLGDLVSVGYHPGVTDGFPEQWLRILDSIRELRADRVVPGHGSVGRDANVVAIQEYLRELVRLARAAHRSGLAREDLRGTPVPASFSEWCFGAFFPDNLLRAYDLCED